MALFFDQSWFDAQLEAGGVTHQMLAEALAIPLTDLVAIWKDQRELSADEVSVLAQILNVNSAEVASRAGISTPVPKAGDLDKVKSQTDSHTDRHLLNRIEELEARLLTLEADIKNLKSNR